ncbi:MAG: hypothetical protein LBP92_04550 [Deltaproteobacteria bacterium]|nr:hypothetical protein [Deltaproteobacteria bacterium]
MDEIDTLPGDVLVSCLRQLRNGYVLRSKIPFPNSIVMVGMRNIRDYKAQIRHDSESLGTSSPFNIIKKAFTLANFSREDVRTLYGQHTEETGQAFEDGAVEQAMFWADGQPWLVNALADDVIERQMGSDFTRPITGDHIDLAADRLKIDMNVHIDSLMARLHESRVKRVMVPILTGAGPDGQASSLEDNQYCLDIGLIKRQSDGSHAPANRIYGDVIVRLLTWEFQNSLPIGLEGRHVGPKGTDISGLLRDFQIFWSGNSDKMSNRFAYQECDAQFSLFGYMQKAFNGTVQLVKEFASGTGFVDVCAIHGRQRYPMELKMKSHSYSRPASMEQLLAYMDRCQAKEGWLVVFDRDSQKPWSRKITWETETLPDDTIIHVVGC